MFIRLCIPLVAFFLFLLEPSFARLSPVHFDDQTLYLVPRFALIYLIFLTIYYMKNRAMLYALILGVLYDVFFIDIIGLYSVLYPAICYFTAKCVRSVHPNLLVASLLSVFFMAVMEFVLYGFFYWIDFTMLDVTTFVTSRLAPTIVANLLFILMVGWAFKYLIDKRVLQRADNHS